MVIMLAAVVPLSALLISQNIYFRAREAVYVSTLKRMKSSILALLKGSPDTATLDISLAELIEELNDR